MAQADDDPPPAAPQDELTAAPQDEPTAGPARGFVANSPPTIAAPHATPVASAPSSAFSPFVRSLPLPVPPLQSLPRPQPVRPQPVRPQQLRQAEPSGAGLPLRDLSTVTPEEVDAAVAEAVNSRAAAAAQALVRARALRPPVDPLREAIRTLLEGGWSEALENLVPTVLVRLPRNHAMHVDDLSVHHADGTSHYGQSTSGVSRYFIRQQPDGSYLHYLKDQAPERNARTPDAFLEIVRERFNSPGRVAMADMRKELAEIMALNPRPMRLRLALFERGWPTDQELLMRLCLVNGQLTMAGRQVMNPGMAQRPVRASDLVRWFRSDQSALRRRPGHIAAQGISVLDAHFHASPSKPTPKGRRLLREADCGIDTPSDQPHAAQLLSERYPELLYAYRTGTKLMHYLHGKQQAPTRFSIPQPVQLAAGQFAAAARAAEQLAVHMTSPLVLPQRP
jgi:hypothetical protein